MTYRAAIHGLAHLGVPDHPTPSIYCDGCNMQLSAMKPNGQPYAWLLNNKAPKGWTLERTEEPFTRRDLCPKCRASSPAPIKGES